MAKVFRASIPQDNFLHSKARYLGFIGGIGCLGPRTILPSGNTLGDVSSALCVETLFGVCSAVPASQQGPADLFSISSAGGKRIVATSAHQLLSPSGWNPLERLHVGALIAVDDTEDAGTRMGKGRGCPAPGPRYPRCDDERSIPQEVALRESFQLFVSRLYECPSGCETFRPSIDSFLLLEHEILQEIASQHHDHEGDDEHVQELSHTWSLCRSLSILEHTWQRAHPLGVESQTDGSCPSLYHDLHDALSCLLELGLYQELLQQHAGSLSPCRLVELLLWSREHMASLGSSYITNNSTHWEEIQDITWDHHGMFCDLIVPGANHYLAQGFWNHNSGKTAAGSVKAVQKIAAGEDGIIVAPDFPQLSRSTWPEFMRWAPMSCCTNAHLDHPYTQKKIITFEINGKKVTIFYGGIEKEGGWAGPNVNWCWFDEAGRKRTKKAFDVLAARIRVGQAPQLWITTTPAGVNHWLYDVFVKQLFSDEVKKVLKELGWKGKIVEYFKGKTEDNKKNLDPFHYAMLTGMYEGEFALQELGGEFVSLEGPVWKSFDAQMDEGSGVFAGRSVSYGADYIPGVPIEWWVDDGFTKGHPRVILMAQIIPPNLHVFNEYIVTGELPESSIDHALEICPERPEVAYVDSSAAELRNRLWQRDIDTISATHDVSEGITRTASWILNGHGETHLFFHPRCVKALAEIPAYVRDPVTQKPMKRDDNAADALRYGVWPKDREEIWGEEVVGDDVYDPANFDNPEELLAQAGGNSLLLPEVETLDLVTAQEVYSDYLHRWAGMIRQ